MNRVVGISPSILLVCVVGFGACGCLGRHDITMVANFPRIEGIVAASPTPGVYGFADFDRASTGSGNKPFHDKIPVAGFFGPIPFEAEGQAIALSIGNGTNFEFHGLLGSKLCLEDPDYSTDSRFCPGSVARGKIMKKQGENTVFVEEGWAYVWANPSHTRADSDWVAGGTKGSGFALEIVGDNLHRIYFLSGTEAWYACPPDGDEIPWTTPNQYINVNENCDFDGPHDIDDYNTPDHIRRFAEELPKMTTLIP